jgi:hypothetical protein
VGLDTTLPFHRSGSVTCLQRHQTASQQSVAVSVCIHVIMTVVATGEAMADREILGTLWGYLWNPEHGFRGRLAGAMGLLLISKALNITVSSVLPDTSGSYQACCRA